MGDIVFKIEVGGFFAGQHTFTIRETDSGYEGTYESLLGLDDAKAFPISEGQLSELQEVIDVNGVADWYTDYFNPCVLDGVQWTVDDGEIEHSGSNFFPKGFKALAQFVSEEFGLVEFMPEDDFVDDSSNEATELAIVASMFRSDDASGQLLHDLSVFADRHPRYKDYARILKEHGLELNPDLIKSQDMSNADPELIIASMIALSRVDHFDGYSEHFKTAAEDGTFQAWLERLNELVLPGAWIN